MSVQKSPHNPYPGINAHLNSFLQSEGGGWEMFHAVTIGFLASHLEVNLPGNYFVADEKSLQVFDEEDYLSSVVIYRLESNEFPGKPITRIELLSPENKPGGSHHANYLMKRRETLESGLRLVEIDWLHETRPVIRGIPSYPDHEDGAFPYWVIVSDPRPSLALGKTDVYGVGMDEILPVTHIPLDDEDVIPVDFGLIYKQTFESRRLFSIVSDYTKEPPRFQTYAPADQARIRQRMA